MHHQKWKNGLLKTILFIAVSFLISSPVFAQELTTVQQKLLDAAQLLDGKSSPVINGKTFTADCSGTARAMYWHAGVDLAFEYSKYPGNGTGRILQTLSNRKLLVTTDEPQRGDLVFWSDTYDANGNGLRDDLYTHIGLVIGIDASGTITYVHYDYRGYVATGKMNLKQPATASDAQGHEINSGLRLGMPGEIRDGSFLAGALWAGFGRAWQLSDPKALIP